VLVLVLSFCICITSVSVHLWMCVPFAVQFDAPPSDEKRKKKLQFEILRIPDPLFPFSLFPCPEHSSLAFHNQS
jgi:hypothetical protein